MVVELLSVLTDPNWIRYRTGDEHPRVRYRVKVTGREDLTCYGLLNRCNGSVRHSAGGCAEIYNKRLPDPRTQGFGRKRFFQDFGYSGPSWRASTAEVFGRSIQTGLSYLPSYWPRASTASK